MKNQNNEIQIECFLEEDKEMTKGDREASVYTINWKIGMSHKEEEEFRFLDKKEFIERFPNFEKKYIDKRERCKDYFEYQSEWCFCETSKQHNKDIFYGNSPIRDTHALELTRQARKDMIKELHLEEYFKNEFYPKGIKKYSKKESNNEPN